MLNPVVISLPTALGVLALLALAAVAWRRWVERGVLTFDDVVAAVQPKAARGGRHRLGAVAQPYQPRTWDAAHEPAAEAPPVAEASRPKQLPVRSPGVALAAELDLGVFVLAEPGRGDWRGSLIGFGTRPAPTAPISAPPARPRFTDVNWAHPGTHPAPCGYPDVIPCICSKQQADGWTDALTGETGELETVR